MLAALPREKISFFFFGLGLTGMGLNGLKMCPIFIRIVSLKMLAHVRPNSKT